MRKENTRSSFQNIFLLQKKLFLVILLILTLFTSLVFALDQSGTLYNLETVVVSGGSNSSSTSYQNLISMPLITGMATSNNYGSAIGAVYALTGYSPSVSSVILASSSGSNYTTDNLTVTYTTSDPDFDTVYEAIDWKVNGSSIAFINTPFNRRVVDVDYPVKDYSDTNYNGSLGGGNSSKMPRWNNSCVVGGCYYFDGNDIINFGEVNDLDLQTALTLSIWIKMDASELNGDFDIIANEGHGTTYPILWWRDETVGSGDQVGNTNSMSIHIYNPSGTTKWISLPSGDMNDLLWHHYVFTMEVNSSTGMNLYKDGVLRQTGDTLDLPYIQASAYDLLIGDRNTGGYGFNGYFDEFLMFDRALTADQVNYIYTVQSSGNPIDKILSNETSLTDVWSAKIFPVDEFDEGTSVTSNTVSISSSDFEISLNNTFVNYTNAHSFNVTAGAYYSMGSSFISNVTINYDSFSCVYASNSSSTYYLNATFTCSGTPYVSTNVNVTFCDYINVCITTPLSSNDYPNVAPSVSSVTLTSTSGNNFTTDNLTVSYLNSDTESDNVVDAIDWRVGGESIAMLNLPFILNSTTVTDFSTNSNTLTATNAPYYSSERNGSYSFDGGITTGDYLTLSTKLNVSFLNTTISFWAKRPINSSDSNNTNEFMRIFGSSASTYFNFLDFGVDDVTGRYRFSGERDVNSEYWASIISSVTADTSWHHFVLTMENNVVKLYVDGTYQGVDNDNLSGYTSNYFQIDYIARGFGATNTVYASYYNGSLDEIYIFNRTLSLDQITQLYNDGLANKSLTKILSNETSVGDVWTANVTPSDSYDLGTSVLSNSVLIGAGTLTLVLNNTFVNYTTAHSFNVTAGVNYSMGYEWVDNVTINYDSYSCVYASNSSSTYYLNVTFTCTGTPYQTTNLNITFCDFQDTCVSSTTSGNDYPNQAPTLGSLTSPIGNGTYYSRNESFNWTAASDVEGDDVNYSINITHLVVVDPTPIPIYNITNLYYYLSQELRTLDEIGAVPDNQKPYYWTLQACDAWDCSSWSSEENFTITPLLSVSITQNLTNFDELGIGMTVDTDSVAQPFIFENDGNVNANITNVTALALWSTVSLDTSYFQMKSDVSEAGSYNETSSVTSWKNVTGTSNTDLFVGELNYSDANDELQVDFRVTVPGAEPAGSKSSIVNFQYVIS